MISETARLQSRIDDFDCGRPMAARPTAACARGSRTRRLLLLAAIFSMFLAGCAATRMEQPDAKLLEDATQELAKEGRKLCAQDEYKLIRKKHSCSNSEITPEQMADKSRISDEERPVFSKFAAEIKALQYRVVNAYRNHGGAKGAAIADAMARASAAAEKNAASLYARGETWGQYNRRRKEASLQTHEELRKINQQ